MIVKIGKEFLSNFLFSFTERNGLSLIIPIAGFSPYKMFLRNYSLITFSNRRIYLKAVRIIFS